ncbi:MULTISPECIES: ABC transporter ATP-binding protein [unclassified Bifidobacterium]|uniref:ABC transporter ATP-binding protein n=1 Tax=unclassified Bifidobacterium TaxID=2608897 RepID=UPI001126F4F5|nr:MULTISPECIES: ABC transporter ATP-binding protein [unclassified Bifidobacterium]TPF78006.1 sugar ABC transporter [Bifidobacterium sp. UTCIF-1]TPF80211.1 sugar ABC transporter [Bifidobacterium sp. UTCIF-24]TPF83033.1 sugar ABC transporter [Bifidobacterium sp. UTCIF-3]TPF84231.1 sugar ABC transporter [Bifidobacterium sp. UTCIF-36]TPF90763.1 sugar ABC transporter [Bifidobacterium sp. UTBIF-56]
MSGNNTIDTAATNDTRPVVLKVEHVAKYFRLPTEQATGLKMAFLNWTRGIKGYTEQHVLRDINFEVHQGDFFGIVGRNGSGKSTLLKIISQIYKPEQGKVTVKGKLVPFIELGVGFNPELTGRENVYLNGALLGFTREEIDAMYDDIVDFAELGEFMDQKLKNYSSGMQVRLAFSVAIKAQGDILVLDEVLAVGDEAFQRKCDNFFSQIKHDPSKTVILVTHSMDAVKKYCDKAILIKNGEIVVSGNKNDVADQYTLENLKSTKKSQEEQLSEGQYPAGLSERVPKLEVRADSSPLVKTSDPFRFHVEYEFNEKVAFYLILTVLDMQRGGIVYDTAAELQQTKRGHQTATFELPLNAICNGNYRITAQLRILPDPDNVKSNQQLAYTDENRSLDFALRIPGNNGYALLNKNTMHVTQLD